MDYHDLFFLFYFIFKLYKIVLVLPNIKMNPPQVYMIYISLSSLCSCVMFSQFSHSVVSNFL